MGILRVVTCESCQEISMVTMVYCVRRGRGGKEMVIPGITLNFYIHNTNVTEHSLCT